MKAHLETKDIPLLETGATNLRDRILVRVLFYSRCRVTQAIGLRPEDIDFESGHITIVDVKLRLHLSCPECGSGLTKTSVFCLRCGISVKEAAARALEQRRVQQLAIDADTLAMLKELIDRGGPVMRDGKHLIFGINRHRARQIVKECAERAGLPRLIDLETGKTRGISPDRLRDASATNTVNHGNSGDGLGLLLDQPGHTGFNTTAQRRETHGEEQQAQHSKLCDSRESDKHGGSQAQT